MTKDDLLYLQIKPRLVDFLKAVGAPYWEPALTVCPHCGEHAEILMDFMWRCSHCKEQGDVVDYVMSLEHMETRTAAIKRICRALQIKITTLEVLNVKDLMDKHFDAPDGIVDGLIGKGVYLLAGAPKIGKSWLMLWLAHRVSIGGSVWEFQSKKSDVLYISLEDPEQRLQSRVAEITHGETGNLWFATETELMGRGFEEQISGFLFEHPTVKFIIVDTLQRVRQLRTDQYNYASDYEIISKMKSLADRFGITILLVHHTRKAGAIDPFDIVSGTTGLTGGVDGILVLIKDDRMTDEATLYVTGRDFLDKQIRLLFDKESGVWKFCGYESEKFSKHESVFCAIDIVLEEIGEFSGTASTLLSLLSEYGELKISSPNALTRLLNSNKSTLQYEFGIKYTTKRTANERLLFLTRVDSFDERTPC